MFDFFEHAYANFGTSYPAQLPLVIWLLIALALIFDFLNGLHDAANSIATVVSTRVLTPRAAVVWAAFFNFVAFVVFPLKVATTIQSDIVNQDFWIGVPGTANRLIAATLLAACGWNVLTWFLGLPTSSSHALIGGMVGAALALPGGGWESLKLGGLAWICMFIVLAPLIGMVVGSSIAIAVMWIFQHVAYLRVDRIFRWGQLVSASLFSLGHGGNDAQKTMGIILVLLVAASKDNNFPTPGQVPTEVVLACHLAMGVGTLLGGWRIVKTMGQRISRLRPVDGFCAETGAAFTLGMTTVFGGIPISTTHTITGAIVGVGMLRRWSAVRWGVASQLVWAWVLTIPGAALMAALVVWTMRLAGW